MNIGFDLDKIFIDYPPFIPDVIFERFYKKKSNGELLYRIPKKPEQLIRYIIHHPLLRPPIQDNMDFLKEFSKTKNNLYLISSRFGFLESRTNDLIKRYNFDEIFKGLYFNYSNKQPHLFKDNVIKELKIQKYVDDDFPLVKYLAKHNPRVQFYWLNPKEDKRIMKNIQAITQLTQMESTK
jgi:hypothetical protein